MSLSGFNRFSHTHQDITHDVYYAGKGPAVILMHEMPGMVPECIAFAERLTEQGYTVYLPLFFGRAGQPPEMVRPFLHLCISREFYLFARNQTSPVISWLRSLTRRVFEEQGGKGVGVIGMCLTGGFAIPLMVEPSVVAPVLSQPSLPVGLRPATRRNLGAAPKDLQTAREKTEAGVTIRAYRFDRDRMAPRSRMEAYQEFFGEAFHYYEVNGDQQKPYGKGCHSVFTLDFVDEPGHPTRQALEDLIGFFEERLK